MISRPPQITESHLSRRGCRYGRLSSDPQVKHNLGSQALQRDVGDILVSYGWTRDQIDDGDDLGISAREPGLRPGFDRLIEGMKAGTYGIVGVTDISRLFRNGLEKALFAVVAERHDVLLLHGTQITDFKDANSEFLYEVLGANARRENRARAAYGRDARRKKAEQGFATTRAPAGYVTAPEGNWVKDPDGRVRDAVQLVWDKASELRSAGRVVRFFRRNGVNLPRRQPGGALYWREATRALVVRMLRDEAYAGTYVYGKTAIDHSRPPYEKGQARRLPIPAGQWGRCEDHHESYVSWERWADTQNWLTANRFRAALPPIGRGESLCQGLLHCTIHKVTFRTTYPVRPGRTDRGPTRPGRYHCDPREHTGESKACVQILARVVDQVIEVELLRTLVPPSADLLREEARAALREHEALVRARHHELQRAEQLVAERERAWDQVEDGQPLLKRRFRDRLSDALAALEEVKTSHRLNPLIPPLSLDEAEFAELRGLLEQLPDLWPRVGSEERKTLVRRVIKVVRVTPGRNRWLLEIEWVGGARTPHELVTNQGIVAELERALREGLSPAEIVAHFRQRGIVHRLGPETGAPYTEQSLRAYILRTHLQRPIDQAACAHIHTRCLDGAPYRVIADELNRRGSRFHFMEWTAGRVAHVVSRLRRGRVPGIGALPEFPSLREPVQRLHEAGLSAGQIAARLQQDGVLTRRRHPVTISVVCGILKHLGLRSNAATQRDRLVDLLKAWASTETVREITRRANASGFRGREGKPWTENEMNRKVAMLGLRVPKKRRPKGFLDEPVRRLHRAGLSATDIAARLNKGLLSRICGEFSVLVRRQGRDRGRFP